MRWLGFPRYTSQNYYVVFPPYLIATPSAVTFVLGWMVQRPPLTLTLTELQHNP